jgi:nucleoside-diphosphate-sugar epimerase
VKSDKLHIGISGKNGFVASSLISYFEKNEVNIQIYSKPYFDLNNLPSLSLHESLDVYIHVAWISETNHSDKNVAAVKTLAEECRQKKIQFIFISSFSAHSDAISEYGKTKFQCETLLQNYDACVIKPGLIAGKGGLFYRMFSEIKNRSFQIIPGNGNQPIQIISIDDFCFAVHNLCADFKAKIFHLAHPKVISLTQFQHEICRHLNKPFIKLKVPLFILQWLVQLAKLFSITLPFTQENINGLKALRTFETSNDLKIINLEPKSLEFILENHFAK